MWIPPDGEEPDSTERDEDVATNETNEELANVEEQQVVEQATEESQDWCMHEMHDGRQVGCPKDPWDGRRNERRTSSGVVREFQHLQGDVADDRNVTIIELGDDRSADDESDGKPNKSGRRSGLRPRGREDVSKNIGGRIQVSDEAKRFASEVGLR